jgi:metal-dependent amidase/aminoacylase/carboxypeptidase family protein
MKNSLAGDVIFMSVLNWVTRKMEVGVMHACGHNSHMAIMMAVAEVIIPYSISCPVTFNDPDLVAKMLPSLQQSADSENVILWHPVTGYEDFSFI